MKKLSYVVLLLTFLLLLVSCESPMKVKLHELDDVIGAFFNRSQLKEGGNCSIGYQNGNIRTSKVALSWSVSSDEDFVFYKLYRDGEDLGVFNDVNFTSYSDSLVQENTSYDYEIAVFVRSGMAAVDTIKIKTPQWQAPSNLMANGLSNTDSSYLG
ncbi:MAG TPA: hypothetical protein PLD62_05860 [Candidatus Cloacimonadota bacterium]|nr:hypothetical protein [Candidatus Cloacimonadota bacterium]